MRAVVKSKPDVGIEIMDVPRPRAKEGEVVVRVEACGICGTDVHFYEWPEHSRWITLPRVLGHEVVGEVGVVGPRVIGFSVGDRVVTETWGGCGKCYFCRLGRFNSCETQMRIGQHSDGGMARYVSIPAVSLFRIPSSMNFVDAAVLEPLGVALHALERSEFKPGDDAVVIGPGPIGLLATELLQKAGAGSVIVAGLVEDVQRLSFAKQLGAIPINLSEEELEDRVDEITDGRKVDLVLEASGGKGALDRAVQIVKPGGQVGVIGLGPADTFDYSKMVHKEVSLIGCWRRQPSSWYRAINMVSKGKLQPGKVVTHQFPLEKAEDGFQVAISRQAVKVLLIPDE